jgi:hypothetical protein
MKSFMKYSKLLIATLVTSSLFVACSDEISENTIDTQYTVNVGNIKSAGQAVNLGLPSGTMWADKNVGATSESDNGILFIWGDATGTQILATTPTAYTDATSPLAESVLFDIYKAAEEKVGYVYDTIKVHSEAFLLSEHTLSEIDAIREATFDSLKTKYEGKNLDLSIKVDATNYEIIGNVIDSTTIKYFESTAGGFDVEKGASISGVPVYSVIADANHDPATANWGSNWKMPTTEQVRELITKCKWEFTGNGYRVTGPNKNSIFLPAAGYRYGEKWYGNGNAGYYATGEILGSYNFPSMLDQSKGSKGAVSSSEDMPNMLIFQHGQFDNSLSITNNLSTSIGISIRPVAK